VNRGGNFPVLGIARRDWRVILLASLGGALEFYDFVIYGMFAQYIGATFFPAADPLVSLALAFGVFAAGYLARPLGGIVLASFGDRHGRRQVLIFAILTMTGSTVAMGLLPGYASWGVTASFLMIALRLLQGLCLGGELPGAITYVVETAPRTAGLASGTVFFCVNTGVVLAALLNLAVHGLLTPAEVAAWGWRIGFLLGGVLGLISFWLRLSLEESREFTRLRATAAASARPLRELFASHTPQVLTGIAALAATAGFNGLLFAMPAFLPRTMGYAPLAVIEAQNVGLAVLSVGLLCSAWLGDRMPRRHLLGIGALLLMLSSYPFFAAAAARSVGLLPLFAAAGLVAALCNGTMSGIAADLFPTRIRFSGVAVVLNVSFAVFSGLAPLLATLLVRSAGAPTGAAWFMIGCAALTLLASVVLGRYDGRIAADTATDGSNSAIGRGSPR
jgi:MHS family proline/betaine transporter-like MFS transporter